MILLLLLFNSKSTKTDGKEVFADRKKCKQAVHFSLETLVLLPAFASSISKLVVFNMDEISFWNENSRFCEEILYDLIK